MANVPRASLCITILDDEDYRVLMAHNSGLEAFGVFVAMLICGRERLGNGKARRLSETESLTFDNSTTHILALTHISQRQLDRCLNTLFHVAKDCDSKPWMYLDESSHLVIRSFFKFNTKTGWGGSRPGAGRPSIGNQDEKKPIQDKSSSESTGIVSGIGIGIGINPPYPPRGDERERESFSEVPEAKTEPPSALGSLLPKPLSPEAQSCITECVRLWPDQDGKPFSTFVPQWLKQGHSAQRVMMALGETFNKGGTSAKYVQRILDNPDSPINGHATKPTPDRPFKPSSAEETAREIADFEARVQAGLVGRKPRCK